MVGRDRNQGRQSDAGEETLQSLCRSLAAAERPRRLIVAVARVEQDRAAGFEITVEAIDRLRRGRRLVGGDRPINQRKEGQLIPVDIDGHRLSRLDRGAPGQRGAQPFEPGAAHCIDRGIAGFDISEVEFRGRLQSEGVVGMRRRRTEQHGE